MLDIISKFQITFIHLLWNIYDEFFLKLDAFNCLLRQSKMEKEIYIRNICPYNQV